MQMPWETIFTVANCYAVLCWLVVLFAPNREAILPKLFLAGSGLLALAYALLILGLMSGFLDSAGPRSGDFSTLAGVMALFDSKGGATIGWIHYLAFDLLAGIWVARNADRHGYSRLVQAPILFFVFMLGPLGLTLYLLLRLSHKNPPENAVAPC